MEKIVLLQLCIALAYSAYIKFDYTPASIKLPSAESYEQVSLYDTPTIFANLLGLTAEKPNQWQSKGDLLNRPAAGVIFLKTQETPIDDNSYKLVNHASTENFDIETLGDLIDLQMSNRDAVLVQLTETDLAANHASDFDPLAKVENLETTGAEFVDVFLENVQRLIIWLNNAKLENSAAHLYTITVPTFESDVARDAIDASLEKLKSSVRAAYKDNVLIVTIASTDVKNLLAPSERSKQEALNFREKRQVNEEAEQKPLLNTDFYSDNYSAMFSIILFTSLALALAIAFISFCMWTIEPDKDAIIYRLTMPRQAKKDL